MTTSTRVSSACDEVADAMCVVMRARDLAPEIESELVLIEDRLATLRRALEDLCGAVPTTTSALGSLYSWTSSPDDPEWEAKLIAVMTVQIHVRAARSSLFGPAPDDEEEDAYDEPVPSLLNADDLRGALDDIDAALSAARQTLRSQPH